jgi:hypothetical protein
MSPFIAGQIVSRGGQTVSRGEKSENMFVIGDGGQEDELRFCAPLELSDEARAGLTLPCGPLTVGYVAKPLTL